MKLGVLYQDGTGVGRRTTEQAGRWYRIAAAKRACRGEFNLAKLYSAGKGCSAGLCECLLLV